MSGCIVQTRTIGKTAVTLQDQTVFPQWVRETRAPVPLPPPKSCDCQFHIYGDPAKYPPKKDALYQPPDATFADMRGVLKALGIERGVIVHPMPYDTDHRLLIDTLSGLAPAGAQELPRHRHHQGQRDGRDPATARRARRARRALQYRQALRRACRATTRSGARSSAPARSAGTRGCTWPPTTSRPIRNSWNRSRTSPAWSTTWPTCISTAGSISRPAAG